MFSYIVAIPIQADKSCYNIAKLVPVVFLPLAVLMRSKAVQSLSYRVFVFYSYINIVSNVWCVCVVVCVCQNVSTGSSYMYLQYMHVMREV